MLTWIDVLGLVGVGCVVAAYFLLQAGRLDAKSIRFSLINLVGSILILMSLMVNWNTASVVIEIIWMSISSYGLFKGVARMKQSQSMGA